MTDYVSRCKELVYQKQKEQEADKQKKNNLHIMTMHMAKGLEFDTVYLPDLNEGKIPMRQARLPRELEEERRMLYVAMTRARKSLYLMFCKQKTGIIFRFLFCVFIALFLVQVLIVVLLLLSHFEVC